MIHSRLRICSWKSTPGQKEKSGTGPADGAITYFGSGSIRLLLVHKYVVNLGISQPLDVSYPREDYSALCRSLCIIHQGSRGQVANTEEEERRTTKYIYIASVWADHEIVE